MTHLATNPLAIPIDGEHTAHVLCWCDRWVVSIGGKQFVCDDQDHAMALIVEPAFAKLAADMLAHRQKLEAEAERLAQTRRELMEIERRIESLKARLETEAA